MRILLIGMRGQLGSSLREVLAAEQLIPVGRQELDICDRDRVFETVRSLHPDVVINAAAIRRPDDCEQQPERAFAVNTLGTRNVAQACADAGSTLIQFSTDNVFDGRKTSPYLEDDAPNPVTTYGVSKLAAECFVRNLLDRYFIVRTSGLFGGSAGTSANFVVTMLGQAREGRPIRVATDQRISPTYTLDLARKSAWLMATTAYGIYHVTNTGECSWYEFAQAIFEKAGLTTDLLPTTTEALALRAPRLRYAVLGNGALRRLGADDLPPWQDALDRYLHALGQAAATECQPMAHRVSRRN